MKRNYADMKVYQLRPLLRERGLVSSGPKDDLIARLEQDDRLNQRQTPSPRSPRRTDSPRSVRRSPSPKSPRKIISPKPQPTTRSRQSRPSTKPASSSMEVVCVKVANIRPQGYQDLRAWIADSNHVYVGRAGVVFLENPETGVKEKFPKQASIWANPFTVQKYGRDLALEKYRSYIIEKIKEDPVKYDLESLRGKTLGCWCAPDPCHADILLELLSETQ